MLKMTADLIIRNNGNQEAVNKVTKEKSCHSITSENALQK